MIRLLTDKVLFASGQAVLKPQSLPLLTAIWHILATDEMPNPVRVEGNTDNVPISTSAVPVELGALGGPGERRARARGRTAASRRRASRSPATAEQDPVASNATASGRSLNRRVDIVVLRNPHVQLGRGLK